MMCRWIYHVNEIFFRKKFLFTTITTIFERCHIPVQDKLCSNSPLVFLIKMKVQDLKSLQIWRTGCAKGTVACDAIFAISFFFRISYGTFYFGQKYTILTNVINIPILLFLFSSSGTLNLNVGCWPGRPFFKLPIVYGDICVTALDKLASQNHVNVKG